MDSAEKQLEMPEIVDGYPPNIDVIRAHLPETENAVYAYAPKIYNPTGKPLGVDLILHEHIHILSQGTDPAGWWTKYLLDKEFRLQEELIAYATQYYYGRKHYHHRIVEKMLSDFGDNLSGPMYGNLIEKYAAEAWIRRKAKLYAMQ